MWNKLCLIFLIGGLACSLSAQSSRSSRRNRNRNRTQTTSVEQKQTDKKAGAKTSAKKKDVPQTAKPPVPDKKIDLSKPALTQNQVDSVMNDVIRKKLLECKLREKLPGHKDDEEDVPENSETPEDGKKKEKYAYAFVSRLDFAILMSEYKSLLDNFELIEVTRIRPEWYQQYQAELSKFGTLVNAMTIALRTRSAERYAAAVQKFKEHQTACLKFLKEKPPRISKDQYDALVLKNTKIRQQNYLKMLQEKRQAELKRREALLKQKTQPKNQSSQKPASGAGK